jgi:hypothetical protein
MAGPLSALEAQCIWIAAQCCGVDCVGSTWHRPHDLEKAPLLSRDQADVPESSNQSRPLLVASDAPALAAPRELLAPPVLVLKAPDITHSSLVAPNGHASAVPPVPRSCQGVQWASGALAVVASDLPQAAATTSATAHIAKLPTTPVTRMLVMRHAHRADEDDEAWAATAPRPWDPPLSEPLGRTQADNAAHDLASASAAAAAIGWDDDDPDLLLGRGQGPQGRRQGAGMCSAVQFVVCSPYQRCLQTAAALVRRLKLPHGRWLVSWGLAEASAGWELE